ncbi:MAG TPA: hypothetical protein DEQ40_16380 [Oxalobacteraceae bacterium]|jgi:hypothetical protein|nr:hypothetical protein [Oxalobacteraceae bacterium]
MRSLSSANIAALARGELVLRALVQLQLLESTYGFWNDVGNITVGGVTYIGTGALASISTLPATTALSVPNFTLVLSGLDANVLSTFFDYTWHQRPVLIYMALLDPNTLNIVDTPTLISSGRMDIAHVKGADGKDATLEITCEDIARRMTWVNPAVRSNGDQLQRSGTDTFLQYVATTAQQQLYWGQKLPAPVVPTVYPSGSGSVVL